MSNPQSTAKIMGHPIHPMLVPIPIGLLLAAFGSDVVYWFTRSPIWATASLWLLGAGVVMALGAALGGLTDFLGEPRIRRLHDAWWHAGGNIVIVLLAAFTWYQRYRYGEAAVLPWGLVITLIIAGGLMFTGWKGGELVFRHRVGVHEDPARAGETAVQASSSTRRAA